MAQSDNLDWAIKMDNVSKTFKLPHEKQTSLKSSFLSGFKKKKYEKQKAVDDVSFRVKKGDFFGIVGRNGSGKSTLLKMIAGVYQPNKGRIDINGSLVPFIELGVGFNPELSGRDNVFLNGSLLGFSRKQMETMYDDIVEFAELENFMDQKLKNYSSGMQVRLAFSIAIRAKSDILLLDEVLAVGDTAFQNKCLDFFAQLKQEKRTIILVTHNMSIVEQYCDSALLMDKGKIVMASNEPSRVADNYNELNLRTAEQQLGKENQKVVKKTSEHVGTGAVTIKAVTTYNPTTGDTQNTFTNRENIGIKYKIEANKNISSPTVGVVLKDNSKNTIFATNTISKDIKLKDLDKGQTIEVNFEIDNVFNNGTYFISGACASNDRTEVYHRVYDVHKLEIGGWKMSNSMVQPPHKISVKY